MKKLLSILLVLTLVFCATSCGGSKEKVEGSLKTDSSNSSETSDDENTQEEEVDLSLGLAEGNVYESEFLKLGFNLPEGWTFYTDEQIQQLNNITGDMLEEEIAESIKNADLVYDMYALDTMGNSVNINLEKMTAINSAIYSEEDYVNASLSSLEDALKSLGFSSVTAEKTTVSLAGEEHAGISIVCSNDQLTMYEKLVCKKIGNYMACITVATVYSDGTDTVLNQFYTLK